MILFSNIIELFGLWTLNRLQALPDINMAHYTTISNGYLGFRQMIANVNFLLPVPMLLTLMGLIWTIEFSMFTWKLINYLLTKTTGR